MRHDVESFQLPVLLKLFYKEKSISSLDLLSEMRSFVKYVDLLSIYHTLRKTVDSGKFKMFFLLPHNTPIC